MIETIGALLRAYGNLDLIGKIYVPLVAFAALIIIISGLDYLSGIIRRKKRENDAIIGIQLPVIIASLAVTFLLLLILSVTPWYAEHIGFSQGANFFIFFMAVLISVFIVGIAMSVLQLIRSLYLLLISKKIPQ